MGDGDGGGVDILGGGGREWFEVWCEVVGRRRLGSDRGVAGTSFNATGYRFYIPNRL